MAITHHIGEGHELRRRFGLVAAVFTLMFVILMGRYFYLQIIRGDEHREEARVSFTKHQKLPARRGRILDRNGVVLADNVERFSATLLPHAVREPEARERVLDEVQGTLLFTDERRAEIEAAVRESIAADDAWQPVPVQDGLVARRCPHDGVALELDPHPPTEGFCSACGELYEHLPADATRCPHDKRPLKIAGDGHNGACPKCKRTYVIGGRVAAGPEAHEVHAAHAHGGADATCPVDQHALRAVERNLVCPKCKRRYIDEVAVLDSHAHELPGVRLATDLMRTYPEPLYAPHLLGSVNHVTREDREKHPGVYDIDARIGRSGIERTLEPILRGKPGFAEYFVGTSDDVPAHYQPSEPGRDVWLTIDLDLQRAVRQTLRYHRSGAAVVVDPRTGEILASYSTPGFDPNTWSGRLSTEEWERIRDNPYSPLINKVVTPYAPGSVYKIVTSLAGLDTGLVTAEDTFNCPGHYDYGGRRFHCHLREGGHGNVNLVQAMKWSCDVYFYKLGEKLGMDTLARYGHAFGYGESTGVELTERVGIVPTKAWHTDTVLGWQPGFTLSTSIGQGSLTATPLQVASSYVALANGGRMLQMRLVKQYTDDRGAVVQRFLPVELSRLPGTAAQRALIREGLVRVVNDRDGTAPDSAMDAFVVAGKTGTAEAAQTRPGADDDLRRWLKEDHAWFAAYAPADDPQVVVVVFVEHGGSGGKVASPLARRILEAWMKTDLYKPSLIPTSAAREGADDPVEVSP